MAGAKRKIESETAKEPVSLSAFAARRKIWGDQSIQVEAASANIVEANKSPASKKESLSTTVTTQRGNASVGIDQSLDVKADNASALVTSEKPRRSKRVDGSSAAIRPSPSIVVPADRESSSLGAIQHSSFRPTKQTYSPRPEGGFTLKLAEGERLVLLGSYGLKVCEGIVTVYGATLHASDKVHWVHAPHCHALPVIRVTDSAVVEFHQASFCQGLRQLERLNPVFARLWNEVSTRVPGLQANDKRPETFQLIFTSEDGPRKALLRGLLSPAEWNKKLAEIASSNKSRPPIVFVCGPKSSGKSTFGKMLANRLVTRQATSQSRTWSRVAVLDLDPGQPEYSPPGLISLNEISDPNMSPSFCRLSYAEATQHQVKAHVIAAVTPGQDPQHYLDCVRDLVYHYRTKLGGKKPLVINTAGWILGTGLDILAELIKMVKPTEVVYMSNEGPEETVQTLRMASSGSQFSTLPSQPSEYTSRTSLHLRTMQTMSYFHLKPGAGPLSGWQHLPLTEMPPWKVRYSGNDRGILGIMCYDSQVPAGLLAEAINGTVLALVKIEDKAALDGMAGPLSDVQQRNQVGGEDAMDVDGNGEGNVSSVPAREIPIVRTPEGLPLIPNPEGKTLDPRYSRALGLVLVRGIDTDHKQLHILTPCPDQAILGSGQDLVLIAGKFDTPTWAYTEALHYDQHGSTGVEDETLRRVEYAEEDTDSDLSEDESNRDPGTLGGMAEAPWVEKLEGSQKRAVGSKVWRVRRDLGKT